MNRNEYIAELKELIIDEGTLAQGSSDYEIIYQIDGLNIYGGFEYGSRGTDHNILLYESDGIGWDEVLTYGTVVVPETETYISEYEIEQFEALGYERLPLDDNHIAGYKGGAY